MELIADLWNGMKFFLRSWSNSCSDEDVYAFCKQNVIASLHKGKVRDAKFYLEAMRYCLRRRIKFVEAARLNQADDLALEAVCNYFLFDVRSSARLLKKSLRVCPENVVAMHWLLWIKHSTRQAKVREDFLPNFHSPRKQSLRLPLSDIFIHEIECARLLYHRQYEAAGAILEHMRYSQQSRDVGEYGTYLNELKILKCTRNHQIVDLEKQEITALLQRWKVEFDKFSCKDTPEP